MNRHPGCDAGVGFGLILLSLWLYFGLIPRGIVVPEGDPIAALSPDFWPRTVTVVLGLSGGWMMFAAVGAWRRHSRSTPQRAADENGSGTVVAAGIIRAGAAVTVLFLYYWLIPLLGMLVSSMLALLCLLLLGAGRSRGWVLLAVALLLPALLWLFFSRVAQIPLPAGVFEGFWKG